MAWGTPTSIGTNSNASGTTLTLTSVTVPDGALIIVCVTELSSALGAVSDSVNGAYTTGQSGANSAFISTKISFFPNSSGLSSGTITYTKNLSSSAAAISAFYVTGELTVLPRDLAPTATNGNSTAPSITSASPAAAGELFVGAVGYSNGGTFTQDSSNAAYATPPVLKAQTTAISIAGGFVVNAGSGALTYAPTLGTSGRWVAVLVSFKVAVTNQGRMFAVF